MFDTRTAHKMVKCEVESFSKLPNSRQRPTVLNADVSNVFAYTFHLYL